MPIAPFPSPSLSERDLAHIWEGQRFPAEALATRRGEPLRVVYRGRATGGAGPDFRDAIIAAPWGLLKGEVELHVRASDFRRHGHHLDAAYDGLALHVVFWDDEGEDTRLACGRRVPVVALAAWAERRAQEIRRWLERPALWEEPCRSAIERLGAETVATTLGRLGDLRFRQKAEAYRRLLRQEEAQEVLWRGLLEALGYEGNRQPFRLLAERLPWRELRAGIAGLPAGARSEAAWEMLERVASSPPFLPWHERGLRPGNAPRTRLAGAAALAARFAEEGLVAGLMGLLPPAAREGPAVLVRALTVREDGRTPIGAGRAQEMLANVVLPFAAAWDEGLAPAAAALYHGLPRPSVYGSVRHLDRAVGGKEGVAIDARRQQGMLYLLRQYCTQGGCGRCPLS